jgi:hypothetical protein
MSHVTHLFGALHRACSSLITPTQNVAEVMMPFQNTTNMRYVSILSSHVVLTFCTEDPDDEVHSPAPSAVRFPFIFSHSTIISHTSSQGVYTKPRSIVVLCMYLGQLSKLREAFASSRVTVTLDSRDQEALLDKEGDKDTAETSDSAVVHNVQLHHQVRALLIL